MSETESFITYMNSMRNYYRSNAFQADVMSEDSALDKTEDDVNLYSFFYQAPTSNDADKAVRTNDKIRSINPQLGTINNIDKNINNNENVKPLRQKESPLKSNKTALNSDQQKIHLHTNATVVKLFDQADLLNDIDKKTKKTSPTQKKSTLGIKAKISSLFSKSIPSLFK